MPKINEQQLAELMALTAHAASSPYLLAVHLGQRLEAELRAQGFDSVAVLVNLRTIAKRLESEPS